MTAGRWSRPGPQRCHWRGCASKTIFRNPSSLNAHISNIHTTPLVCTEPDCSYKKPFGKPHDLKRHLATIHNTESGHHCLENDCPEVFSRKDKMMKHAREKHKLFACPHYHCSATVFAIQREMHLLESHDIYECGIGSCISDYRSCFTAATLKRHLRTCHRMTYDPILHLMEALPSKTKEDQALYAVAPLRLAYQDCATCLSKTLNEYLVASQPPTIKSQVAREMVYAELRHWIDNARWCKTGVGILTSKL